MEKITAVTLLSGGLDSSALAYWVKGQNNIDVDLICLSFDYGQRHRKELMAAGNIAARLDAEHYTITIGANDGSTPYGKPLASILGGSALTDEAVPVPDGHYAEETMKQTIVPNRNAIMLSIAYGVAVARGAKSVSFAAHSGDHAIYPDCRPEFVQALNTALQIGNSWGSADGTVPEINGPFLEMDKAAIARTAFNFGVPIAETWSCYKGQEVQCGTCGTCTERREAFELAGIKDPTPYQSLERHW